MIVSNNFKKKKNTRGTAALIKKALSECPEGATPNMGDLVFSLSESLMNNHYYKTDDKPAAKGSKQLDYQCARMELETSGDMKSAVISYIVDHANLKSSARR